MHSVVLSYCRMFAPDNATIRQYDSLATLVLFGCLPESGAPVNILTYAPDHCKDGCVVKCELSLSSGTLIGVFCSQTHHGTAILFSRGSNVVSIVS